MSFLDLQAFPELFPLQHHYKIFLDELPAVKRWLSWRSDAPDASGHCLFLTGEWTVFPVYVNMQRRWQDFFRLGSVSPAAVHAMERLLVQLPRLFPGANQLLCPLSRINYAAFSRLHPWSKLAPHRHQNTRSYIHHLGLVIPASARAGLMVAERVHWWTRPGEAVVFDDTAEHSAWNDTNEERIILYTDFNRDANH
jgi:hypothetical protein